MGNFAKSQTFFARIGKTPGKDLITPAKQRGTLHECHTYRLIIDSLCRAVPHRHHGRAVRSLSLFLRCPLRKAPRFCRAAHAWKGSRILQASRWGRAQRARERRGSGRRPCLQRRRLRAFPRRRHGRSRGREARSGMRRSAGG